MEKKANVRYGILIHKLSENLKWEALKSLEESISISICSIISITIDKLGLNIVFDGYGPFYKAITKRMLDVSYISYDIYPMATDLTVIGAGPFLTESVLKSLMSNIAPVLEVYLECDQKAEHTNNYRVIMNHPEIYDLIKSWPLMHNIQIPGSNIPLQITFFCRLCRKSGHTRHQCNGSPHISGSDEKSQKLKCLEKRQISEENFKYSSKQDNEKDRSFRDKDFTKISKTKQNDFTNETNTATNADSPKKALLKRRTPKRCQKVRFYKLIPSDLHVIIPQLKTLFLNINEESFSEAILGYPGGINTLLRHLHNIVQFNLKEMCTNRSSQERRFVIWVDSLLNKIKEEYTKNIQDRLSSSLNLKIENHNKTKNESKRNKDFKNMNNDTFKKLLLKRNIRINANNRKMYEDARAQMINRKSVQNKHTLNTIKRNEGISPKNIQRIDQSVNLESVIKNIKSNSEKNEPRIAEQNLFPNKSYANQKRKVKVRMNQKLSDIYDVGRCRTQVVYANKVSGQRSVITPEAKLNIQKERKCLLMGVEKNRCMTLNTKCLEVHDDKKDRQKNSFQGTKADDHKDPPLAAFLPKESSKKKQKSGKVFAKLSPGLLATIRSSKGVLNPSELNAFLIHVKGIKHVRKMAKNYSLEVNKLIEQLEVLVNKHYRGVKVLIAPSNREIEWIKELIDRLKAHESCETCLNLRSV